jgi:hypothetical protein
VLANDDLLGFHLEDGRFISVPLAFYPTLALATPDERGRFEINGSAVYWPDLDADIGVEGLLAGAREHLHYRAQSRGTRRPPGPAAQDRPGKNAGHTAVTRLIPCVQRADERLLAKLRNVLPDAAQAGGFRFNAE